MCFVRSGIKRVVYGVAHSRMPRKIDTKNSEISSKEIFSRMNSEIKLIGPVMEEEGLEIHRTYWPTT